MGAQANFFFSVFMMIATITVIVPFAVVAVAAVASPSSRVQDSICFGGTTYCCDSMQAAKDYDYSQLSNLVGVEVYSLIDQVGTRCTPVAVLGEAGVNRWYVWSYFSIPHDGLLIGLPLSTTNTVCCQDSYLGMLLTCKSVIGIIDHTFRGTCYFGLQPRHSRVRAKYGLRHYIVLLIYEIYVGPWLDLNNSPGRRAERGSRDFPSRCGLGLLYPSASHHLISLRS